MREAADERGRRITRILIFAMYLLGLSAIALYAGARFVGEEMNTIIIPLIRGEPGPTVDLHWGPKLRVVADGAHWIAIALSALALSALCAVLLRLSGPRTTADRGRGRTLRGHREP